MGRPKTKSRSRSKNKLLLCFKPTVMDSDPSTHPVFANHAVKEKEISVVLPPTLLSALPPELMADCGEKSCRPSGKNRYWKVLKMALKEALSGKKIRKTKAANDKSLQSSSIHSSSGETDQSSNSLCKPTDRSPSSSICSSASTSSSILFPPTSSSSLSSSSSSQTFSSSPSFEMKRMNSVDFSKQIQKRQDGLRGSRNRSRGSKMQLSWIWIVVSLLVLILWGRVCSIVCTCIWLYLLPRRSSRGGRRGSKFNSAKVQEGGFIEDVHGRLCMPSTGKP